MFKHIMRIEVQMHASRGITSELGIDAYTCPMADFLADAVLRASDMGTVHTGSPSFQVKRFRVGIVLCVRSDSDSRCS